MSTTIPNAPSPIHPSTSGPVNGAPKAPLIRAVSSKIFTKSAPTLPSPAESYEPLVKALFRHRLQVSLFHSAVYIYIIINLWTLWQAGGLTTLGFWGALWIPINPWTMGMALLAWTSLAVPVTVSRKAFLTAQRLATFSPLSTVRSAFAQKSTRVAVIIHFVSACCALLFHVLNEYSYSRGDPKLTIFVKSRKHPHYLNGRLLFLVFTQVLTALAFVLRGALADRFVYQWALAMTTTKDWRTLMVLIAVLASLVNTILAVAAGMAFFGLVRMLLPIFCSFPVVSSIFRPFAAHFLKGPWTILLPLYHLKLVARAASLSFTTFLVWELTDNMFDRVVAERATLSILSKDPNITLVSGTTSTNQVFKFFAYSELRELAMQESPEASGRRTALFDDQKMVPNLWTCLSRESLLLLGHHYQLLLRRGQPPAPPSTPAPIPSKILPGPEIGTPTKLLRESIFKSTKESPGQAALDAFASDGPIAQALDAGADATHIPEIFRSVETKVFTSPVAQEAKKNVEHVAGFGNRLKESVLGAWKSFVTVYIPEPMKEKTKEAVEWWNWERSSRKVEASLAFRELDLVVIDVLSYLICASLTEDRYGVVQRDIPKILEAMVSMLSAVEAYQREIDSQFKPSPQSASTSKEGILRFETMKSKEILSYLEEGLREGIARIVRTFGDKLLAFKFPPAIAQKLQLFLDYA